MQLFRPILAGANLLQRTIGSIGAAICLAVTIVICAQAPLGIPNLPAVVAPLGASAVLIFAIPASPLAQPWPVVGGNVISTIVGVAAYRLIPEPALAAGAAVACAILAMSLLRCLHPPGGAAALTAVIGGHEIHAAGYAFAFLPVGLNSIALVALAILYHRWTGHSYPHRSAEVSHPAASGIHLTDIDAAIEDMDESFDISRKDLDALLLRAEFHAAARKALTRR